MGGIWGYDWKLRSIIIIQNIILITLLTGGGWLLDQSLETQPLLMLLGLAISFIVNQLVSIKIINWYVAGKPTYNPQDPKNQQNDTTTV